MVTLALLAAASATASLLERAGTAGAAPLFNVAVNLDIESLTSGSAVTMKFEKKHHELRLDTGLGVGDGLAWGSVQDTIETNGWNSLYVNTSPNPDMASNTAKMYSAGYIEGILTCVRMSQHYANVRDILMRGEAKYHALVAIKSELKAQLGFIMAKTNLGTEHVRTEEPEEDYWKHSRFLLAQIWGLADGYNYAAEHFNVHTLSLVDLLILNSGGELATLMPAFSPTAINDRGERAMAALKTASFLQLNKVTREEEPEAPPGGYTDAFWNQRVRESGHCSGYIRLTENNADILVGHATWNDYSMMLRMYKYYSFPLPGAGTMHATITMSSYPGMVSSGDEFYTLSDTMAVFDTSLVDLRLTWYDDVAAAATSGSPASTIPMFMHLMITNRLSKSGSDWASMYTERNNAGTLNGQFMVVDYNLFHPGQPLADNTFFVVETLPGKMHKKDMSQELQRAGYWASVDRPYFTDMRELAGFVAAQKSSGRMYSTNDNPRSTIFRTLTPNVQSLFGIRGVMRRNEWPYESDGAGGLLEPQEPSNAIAARSDIALLSPIPNGAIDAKVTSRCLMLAMSVQAASGPTSDKQVPFRWTDNDSRAIFPGWPHVGMPNVWNFGWQQFTPVGQQGIIDPVC